MGWCSGTEVFDDVVGALIGKKKLKPETVIKKLITTLEDMDWDCQGESAYYDHPMVKKIFKELHPEWFEDAES